MATDPAPSRHTSRTRLLDVAYEQWGPADGLPAVLLHGFPDDVRAWEGVAPALAREGWRVIVPYLRGFGPTRFRDSSTPRVGQQAALGQDVLDLLDALGVPSAVLAGYDWGCTAACAASLLQPERVRALVAIHGYGVGDPRSPEQPAPPSEERECWYHWYFQIERGRRGLEVHRREICLMLWKAWSPNWNFDRRTYELTAASFDNPDFVPVVINAYRHSHGNIAGDASYEEQEKKLAGFPPITVPSAVLHGEADTVHPLHRSSSQMHLFPEGARRIVVAGAGHFVPREAPGAVIAALRDLA